MNEIIDSAAAPGADCLVAACAICRLNLEIRRPGKTRILILHFSESLAPALGAENSEKWFGRHLVDPPPVISEIGGGLKIGYNIDVLKKNYHMTG